MSDVQINHGPVEAVADAPSAADASRDALLAELCGLGATMSAAMEAVPGFVPCGYAFGVVVEGLYAASACGDAAQLDELAADVRARSEHVSAHRGVAQGAVALAAPQSPETALLLAAVRGIASDAFGAMQLGRMDDDVDVFLANALAALGSGAVDHELLTRAGVAAQKAYALAR